MKKTEVVSDIFDTLSDEDIPILQAIHKKHSALLELAVELMRVGYKSFPIGKKLLKKTVSRPVERCLLALYAQAFRLFRAVIILSKSGLDTEAVISLRSLLDAISYILFICEKDYDERLNLYKYSYLLSQYVAVNEFIQDHEDAKSQIDMEWYEKEREEALGYFQKKYGADMTKRKDRLKYGLRPSEAAKKIENVSYKEALSKYYRTFHRDVSMLGHAGKVLAFIKPKEKTKFILGINPRDTYIGIYLSIAIRLYFHVLMQLNELLGLGVTDGEIESLSQKIKYYDTRNKTVIS